MLAPLKPQNVAKKDRNLRSCNTEGLSALCVEALLTTEDTEALLTRGEILAAQQRPRN